MPATPRPGAPPSTASTIATAEPPTALHPASLLMRSGRTLLRSASSVTVTNKVTCTAWINRPELSADSR